MLAVAESWENGKDTVAYHFNEPLGVVGQIVPLTFRC
jgi:acyl-CoA reductase-like NAD-dependent aldehyde dehydrogenase